MSNNSEIGIVRIEPPFQLFSDSVNWKAIIQDKNGTYHYLFADTELRVMEVAEAYMEKLKNAP